MHFERLDFTNATLINWRRFLVVHRKSVHFVELVVNASTKFSS